MSELEVTPGTKIYFDSNATKELERFLAMNKYLKEFQYRTNCVAAARLVVKEQSASINLLRTHFRWNTGYAHRVLHFLESIGIIGPKMFMRSRKILVFEENLEEIITPIIESVEISKLRGIWIAWAFIKIDTNDEKPVVQELHPERALQFNPGDKWHLQYPDTSTVGPVEKEKIASIFGTDRMVFIQITERLFYEDGLELYGTIVPKDGEFYS